MVGALCHSERSEESGCVGWDLPLPQPDSSLRSE
jgi:hypothetical protein